MAPLSRSPRRAIVTLLLLLGTATLGGCYYPPYGYYGAPGYSYAAPAYAPVYVGGGYYGRRW